MIEQQLMRVSTLAAENASLRYSAYRLLAVAADAIVTARMGTDTDVENTLRYLTNTDPALMRWFRDRLDAALVGTNVIRPEQSAAPAAAA